jgi:hypothetical protein
VEAPTPHPTTEKYHTTLLRFGYKNQISDYLILTVARDFEESATYPTEVIKKRPHHFLWAPSFRQFWKQLFFLYSEVPLITCRMTKHQKNRFIIKSNHLNHTFKTKNQLQ